MNVSSLSFGDFSASVGHYDGTHYFLDDIKLLSSENFRQLPTIDIFAPEKQMEVKYHIRIKTPSARSSRSTKFYKTGKKIVQGSYYSLNISELIEDEGNFLMDLQVKTSKSSIKFPYELTVDRSSPVLKDGRFRAYNSTGQLWLSIPVVDSSQVMLKNLELRFNDEVIAEEDREISLVNNKFISMKLAPRYLKYLSNNTQALLTISGIEDCFGNSSKAYSFVLSGTEGTCKIK